MNTSTVIFTAIIAISFFFGCFQGLGSVLRKLLVLIAALLITYWFIPSALDLGNRYTPNFALFSASLISSFLFLFIALIASLLLKAVQSHSAQRDISAGERLLGGLLCSATYGALLGFVTIYGLSLFNSLNNQTLDVQHSALEQSAFNLLSYIASETTARYSPNAAPLIRAVVQNPVGSAQAFERLKANHEVQQVVQQISNADNLEALDENIINASLLTLSTNQDVKMLIVASGLMPSDTASEAGIKQRLSALVNHAGIIKNNPEIQSLLRDPEFSQLIDGNNTFAIIKHPNTSALLNAITRVLDMPSHVSTNNNAQP